MKSMVEHRGPVPPSAPRRRLDWIWLALLFVLVPAVIGLRVPPAGWIPCLWIISAAAWWWTPTPRGAGTRRRAPRCAAPPLRREAGRVVLRFLATAIALIVAVRLASPERLFDWPRTRPELWVAVLVAYPLLSVLPQEVLYRRFFFRRLRALRVDDRVIALASAAAFALVHLIYRNTPAVALSLIGGWFFADTYRRSGSLALVCIEHALYGALVFTVGFGDNFSHFALAAAR